jgi:hypothetical protein
MQLAAVRVHTAARVGGGGGGGAAAGFLHVV